MLSLAVQATLQIGHVHETSAAPTVISEEWIGRTRAGGDPDHARGTEFAKGYPRGSYRNQWWVTAPGAAFNGTGIYGQFLWIDPDAAVVIVKLSSLPAAIDYAIVRDHHFVFRTLCDALR